MRVPTTLEELNSPTTGAVFNHGKFASGKRSVVIDKLHIFSNAIIVETKTSTDDCDSFLSDVIDFASTHLDANVARSSATSYTSQLEVELDSAVDKPFPSLTPIGEKISQFVQGYGFSDLSPQFKLTGMSFFFDNSKLTTTPFPAFTVDRRAQKSFETNLYFTQAPLKTPQHKTLLEELEDLLRV
jgi:hypothetical protein